MTMPALVLPYHNRLSPPAFATLTTTWSMHAKRTNANKPPASKTAQPGKRTRKSYPHPTPRGRTSLSYNNKWERVQPTESVSASKAEAIFTKVSDLRPESCPALVLNADFSPLSYMPLSLWPWQEVVKAVFLDRVSVVATYDIGVRSPGMIFPLPSVISLKRYQPMAVKRPAFSRFNVFMRDNFSCQYCGKRFATDELTFDHVVPRCKGGKTNWGNVVTACIGCNHRKGRLMLDEMRDIKLKKVPREPTNYELQNNARTYPPQYLHESWRDYVYWSQSMEVE